MIGNVQLKDVDLAATLTAIGFCITAIASLLAVRNTRHTRRDAAEAKEHATEAADNASEARRQTRTTNGETLGETTEHVREQVEEGVAVAKDVSRKLDDHLIESYEDRGLFLRHLEEGQRLINESKPLAEYVRRKMAEDDGES